MDTSPLTRSERLEYEETLCVLACLIFEIQVNWTEKVDEDPLATYLPVLRPS
jgi:hypothetical protein